MCYIIMCSWHRYITWSRHHGILHIVMCLYFYECSLMISWCKVVFLFSSCIFQSLLSYMDINFAMMRWGW